MGFIENARRNYAQWLKCGLKKVESKGNCTSVTEITAKIVDLKLDKNINVLDENVLDDKTKKALEFAGIVEKK